MFVYKDETGRFIVAVPHPFPMDTVEGEWVNLKDCLPEYNAQLVKDGFPPLDIPNIQEGPRTIFTQSEFFASLTRSQQIEIRAARRSDPIVDNFLSNLEIDGILDISSLDSIQDLNYLHSKGLVNSLS